MIPRRLFLLFDVSVLVVAFLAAYRFVPNMVQLYSSDPARTLPAFSELSWIFFAMLPGALLFLELCGCYRPVLESSRSRLIFGGLAAPAAGLSFTALAMFALKDPGYSRAFMFSFAAFSSIGFISYRELLRTSYEYRRASGHYARRVVLVGSSSEVMWLTRHFKTYISERDYRIHGYLRVPAEGHDIIAADVTCLGDADRLGSMLINIPIQDVIVVQSGVSEAWISDVIRNCDYFGTTLRIIPVSLLREETKILRTPHSDPLCLPALILTSPHANSEAYFVKRLIDVIVASIFLVILLPVFGVIALAIKLTTPGLKIFYKWRVIGRNGQEFTGYKFTTMISDADVLKEGLQDRNEMHGPVFKISNDPRVTPLGRFLRKYSLNELPQLWSVLKGDMSLVGPRPAFRHELDRYEFWHKRKLSISPGITCLWQIRGRNKIKDFDDWVKMDLEYIDNWSLWLDFKILVRTVFVVLAGTGS
jgi:exopolysaccharide biosynthesis polyprenyl glycosylphosphotransferase